MLVAAEFARRWFGVLVLGIAPSAASLDPRTPSNTISIVLAAAALVALSLAAIRARRHAPAVTVGIALSVVGACVSAAIFRGDAGPMARGVWLVLPFEWLSLGALVLAATRGRPRGVRRGLVALVVVLGAASVLAAWPRIRSRGAMRRAAFAQDPGNEPAALFVAAGLDATRARAALFRCAAANRAACRCVVAAGDRAIAAGRPADAVRVTDASEGSCRNQPGFLGVQADAWVRTGRAAAGEARAEAALAVAPRDAHASFAVGAAMLAAGNTALAVHAAERAVADGYGDDATLLVGLIDLNAGDLPRAEQSFERVRAHQPGNPAAVYDLALIADRRGHFRDAREGYLAALALDPGMADARYNLALLTYRNHAVGEAQHDLDELARVHPDDPRLPELRRMLGGLN